MKKIEINIYSRTLAKWLLGITCAILAVSITMLVILGVGWIDNICSEPGEDIASNPWFDIRIELLFTTTIILTVALFAAILYNYALLSCTANQPVPSILQGDAAENEKQIVAILTSVSKPLPGKHKLNRAAAAQFMRALAELGYIDPNMSAKHILPWIEQVTGFPDGENGHFQAAFKKASSLDSNVQDYMAQIKAIVEK